jgi:hypothetical protein
VRPPKISSQNQADKRKIRALFSLARNPKNPIWVHFWVHLPRLAINADHDSAGPTRLHLIVAVAVGVGKNVGTLRVNPKKERCLMSMFATYYDHRCHQILPKLCSSSPKNAAPDDFISEDDLNTFDGYLRYQAIDPTTTPPDVLRQFREMFEEAQKKKATTPKFGTMKLRDLRPAEYRYAVVVRGGSDLLITMWIRCDPKGDVYVLIPRGPGSGNPHASYHHNGTFHHKSYRRAMGGGSSKRQPIKGFKGCHHMGMFAGHSPKSLGAACEPSKFSGVVTAGNTWSKGRLHRSGPS